MTDSTDRFVQGVRLERAGDAFAAAVAAAVDYRGDVTIDRAGEPILGYLFDATPERIRVMPADGGAAVSVPVAEIVSIEFSGKDAASGRTWENWVRRYVERKRAGEAANIESERLD